MNALYTDGDGRWHSQYIAMTKGMSLDSLLYVMQDCAAAIAANPDNPKCGQYTDERHYCAMELERRRKAFNSKFSN
jgi:hypothetical protein